MAYNLPISALGTRISQYVCDSGTSAEPKKLLNPLTLSRKHAMSLARGAATMVAALGARAPMVRNVRGIVSNVNRGMHFPVPAMQFLRPQARAMSTQPHDFDEYPDLQPTPPPGYVRGTTFEEDMASDPYAPHKENMKQAKAWIKENIKPGMSKDEMMDMAEEAFNKFIPPMRSFEVI